MGAAQRLGPAKKNDELPEEELAEQRCTIARTLIQTNRYSKYPIMSFLVFLKNFLILRDKEILLKPFPKGSGFYIFHKNCPIIIKRLRSRRYTKAFVCRP